MIFTCVYDFTDQYGTMKFPSPSRGKYAEIKYAEKKYTQCNARGYGYGTDSIVVVE